VCGCGDSLNELTNPEQFLTIGVNDVDRRFHPDYLVVVNPRSQFKGDRFRYIETSRAKYIFTQLELGLSTSQVVKFRLGRYGGTDLSDPELLHYTNNSPYVAVCLAVQMGARRIGLLGVDFTDHHFFAKTGRHPLAASLQRINEEYKKLSTALASQGIELVNVSHQSRLTALPREELSAFSAWQARCQQKAQLQAFQGDTMPQRTNRLTTKSLNIVSYATTPVAGVPAILARCIARETSHRARCVWATSSYGNGVAFAGDIEWTKSPAEAEKELEGADVVIVHNGKVASQHRRIIDSKPVITMAHNYRWNVDCHYVDKGFPGVVVGQYQASLPEFRGWNVVPNPIPLWEPEYKPAEKPTIITIAFTPSGKHERFLSTDRLYWHSKGYTTTMAVLDKLAKSYPLQLEVIRNGQVSHSESLAMKQRAHLVIDECVTGSYHRNSLEGLATGCVVINGMHLRIGVIKAFQTCAEIGEANTPFVYADLCSLEKVLVSLIEKGPFVLSSTGRDNHEWMKSHWDFSKQWPRFWAPVVEAAFEIYSSKKPSANTFEPPHLVCSKQSRKAQSCACRRSEALSVVIPHGGDDRLPVLKHTLKTLKVYSEIGEVIIVEMGTQPNAMTGMDGLYDHYVFIQETGVFHKARAINAGLSIASKEFVAFIDNDLIVPPGFLDSGLTELTDRRLDCLIPWNTVRFLSKEDTAKILEEKLDYRVAHQLNSIESCKGNRGGVVLVRREFACSCRGVREEFRGWGGEDDAWFYMAEQLGKAAVTSCRDQHLFHLYHDRSSGYAPHDPLVNPEYPNNLATIRRMQRLRSKEALLGEFPIPDHFRLPWNAEQQMGILRDESKADQMEVAACIRRKMFEIYGLEITECSAVNINACDFLVVLDLVALPLVARDSHSEVLPILGSWNCDQPLSLPVYAGVRHIIVSDAVAPKKLEPGNAKLTVWRESQDKPGVGLGLIQRIVEIASISNLQSTGSDVKIDSRERIGREEEGRGSRSSQRIKRRVVSYSLFVGPKTEHRERYCNGAIRNAMLMPIFYPGWTMRIYHDASVGSKTLDRLSSFSHVELIEKERSVGLFGTFWRFLTIDDSDIALIRDADSRINVRDAIAVHQWIRSGKRALVTRDHPNHTARIMAGAFGIRNGLPGAAKIAEMIQPYHKRAEYGADMSFLSDIIYPMIADDMLVFDEFQSGRQYGEKSAVIPHLRFADEPFVEFLGQAWFWDERGEYVTTSCLTVDDSGEVRMKGADRKVYTSSVSQSLQGDQPRGTQANIATGRNSAGV
jgi:hypothetical protein